VIDKDSLEIKELAHVLIEKVRNFCDPARATDRFSIPRVPPMALPGDFGQIHTSLRAANSRGHGSAE